MAKVMISFPDPLLREVDAYAKATHRKRSEFLKESVLQYFANFPLHAFAQPRNTLQVTQPFSQAQGFRSLGDHPFRQGSYLQEIKRRLASSYGDRLSGVVLYGSEIRGEAKPDSDIDILVLLKGPVDVGRELRLIVQTLYPVQMRLARPIHATPVDIQHYRTGAYELYRRATREGMMV